MKRLLCLLLPFLFAALPLQAASPESSTREEHREERLRLRMQARDERRAALDGMNTPGRLFLTVRLPYVNTFRLTPAPLGRADNQTGFLGFSLGAEYHYARRASVAFDAGAIIDFLVPFPTRSSVESAHTFTSQLYFTLTHRHEWRRFSVGYGPTAARTAWDYCIADASWHSDTRSDRPAPDAEDRFWSYGLSFDAYWKCTSFFRLGIVYRPTIRPAHGSFGASYAHSLSLDLRFHINTGPRLYPRPAR